MNNGQTNDLINKLNLQCGNNFERPRRLSRHQQFISCVAFCVVYIKRFEFQQKRDINEGIWVVKKEWKKTEKKRKLETGKLNVLSLISLLFVCLFLHKINARKQASYCCHLPLIFNYTHCNLQAILDAGSKLAGDERTFLQVSSSSCLLNYQIFKLWRINKKRELNLSKYETDAMRRKIMMPKLSLHMVVSC